MTRAEQAAEVIEALHVFQFGDEVRLRGSEPGVVLPGVRGRVQSVYADGEILSVLSTNDGIFYVRPEQVELV